MLSLVELHMRAALFQFVRLFFREQGFLEVDTPVRQPIVIPERNIRLQKSGSWFLQASPELCMKRLLAAGCEKIFQICPCFRAEERGRLHLEEFMMLEWYRTGADYLDLMADCEAFLRYIKENFSITCAEQLSSLSESIFFGPDAIEFGGSWPRVSVEEAFSLYSPVHLEDALGSGRFEEVLVERIEPHLGTGSPLFLYDYPIEQASLAKTKDSNPRVVERFELYLTGIELANGFSELTDSHEQRQRLTAELQEMDEGPGMPELFLHSLDRLDHAAGIALGLDRLFMLILGKKSLGEVVAFAPSDLQGSSRK
jgi:elongation factor P--(R)-beta-lysine ligase